MMVEITLGIGLTVTGLAITFGGFFYKIGYDVGSAGLKDRTESLRLTTEENTRLKSENSELRNLNLALQRATFKVEPHA